MKISKQSTKILYLIADGYNYNAKLSKFLKKSKATLNSQLNELKKSQLIKGIKKPGNITEYDLNYDKFSEIIIDLLNETDIEYQKKQSKISKLDIKEAETAVKSAFQSEFFQSIFKEHFSVCLVELIELKQSLSLFLRGLGSFTKDDFKKLKPDQAKPLQIMYKYARNFYFKDLIFNPAFILKQRILNNK